MAKSSNETVFSLTLTEVVIILFFTDLETSFLPVIPLFILGLIGFSTAFLNNTLWFAFTGCLVGFFFMWLFRFVTQKIYKRETMGFGDVLLMAAIGACSGIQVLIFTFYIGVISGGIVGMIMILTKKAHQKDYLPFGPFLISGYWVSLFAGDTLLRLVYG